MFNPNLSMDNLTSEHLNTPCHFFCHLSGPHEIRCVKRDFLLQTLENELPKGTIRYSSKIVSIEEDGNVTVLHLADGSTMKTKVR
jgi:hypothetical protein